MFKDIIKVVQNYKVISKLAEFKMILFNLKNSRKIKNVIVGSTGMREKGRQKGREREEGEGEGEVEEMG